MSTPIKLSNISYRLNRITQLHQNYDKINHNECTMLFEMLQDALFIKNKDQKFDLNRVKADFFSSKCINTIGNRYQKNDLPYIFGIYPIHSKVQCLQKLLFKGISPVFVEEPFLRSILSPFANYADFSIYHARTGIIFDDLTCYYDATRASRMELVINSDFELDDEQKKRVQKIIKKIIENQISKYNNQTDCFIGITRKNQPKILVVDQSYGDYSIVKGLANDNTFETMLESAITENPDADIIVKTHPDALGKMSQRSKGYFHNVKTSGNIYRLTDPTNPISLIEQCDRIYVCTSQLGFEALMLGKEVHTYGMPFYAGWGLTIDAQKCARRTRLRSVEDIFYIAYIMFSAYINPELDEPCQIEDAVDFLIKFRELYFSEL